MKVQLSILAVLICFVACKTSKIADSVKIANEKNEARAKAGTVDNEAAEFLVKIADARMMDAKEGALAIKRGTTEAVRNYGRLMVKDQGILLAKIKTIAASMNISLPKEIGADKKDGFKDIEDKFGDDFDKKFFKMMKIDHERDIRDFREATNFKDGKVKDFAVSNLPLIQSHLDGLEELKK